MSSNLLRTRWLRALLVDHGGTTTRAVCRRRYAVAHRRFVSISGWKKTGFTVYANSAGTVSRILEWAPKDGAYVDLCAAAEAKNPVRQLHDAAVQGHSRNCTAPLPFRFT